MRTWLKVWSVPVIALIAWYVLSANDINFGTYILSREMHDEFFRVYSHILGIKPEDMPAAFGKALIVDGGLIGAFIAFRKRKVLVPWLRDVLFPSALRFFRDEDSASIDPAS